VKPVQIGSATFPEVNVATFDLYFHDRDRDIDYGHDYKENFKATFCHQKWHNNVKKGKGKWENIDKDESIYDHYGGKGHLCCTYCIPEHLTNNENNIETHFAYDDGDSDYDHMDATHLDIIIFFAKANGTIKKKSHWYFCLHKKRMFALVPKDMCLIDSATTYTILKSNKFFSYLIMRDINVSIIYSTTNIIEDSRRAIILQPRSWLETY